MSAPLDIPCPACKKPLALTTSDRERGVVIDLYQCADEDCGRKAVVVFEPAGALTDDDRTWIEREVARRGAFFPSDMVGERW